MYKYQCATNLTKEQSGGADVVAVPPHAIMRNALQTSQYPKRAFTPNWSSTANRSGARHPPA